MYNAPSGSKTDFMHLIAKNKILFKGIYTLFKAAF